MLETNESIDRQAREESAVSVSAGPPALAPHHEAPNAEKVASGEPIEWPSIPGWMENPLVFRDANLGIVLVADRGEYRDQWIYRIHGSTPRWCWVSVRKVDERDGFQLVDALNLPKPVSLPPVTAEAIQRCIHGKSQDEHCEQCVVDSEADDSAPASPTRIVVNGDGYMECSACKGEFLFNPIEMHPFDSGKDFPSFCPLCGAKFEARP